MSKFVIRIIKRSIDYIKINKVSLKNHKNMFKNKISV